MYVYRGVAHTGELGSTSRLRAGPVQLVVGTPGSCVLLTQLVPLRCSACKAELMVHGIEEMTFAGGNDVSVLDVPLQVVEDLLLALSRIPQVLTQMVKTIVPYLPEVSRLAGERDDSVRFTEGACGVPRQRASAPRKGACGFSRCFRRLVPLCIFWGKEGRGTVGEWFASWSPWCALRGGMDVCQGSVVLRRDKGSLDSRWRGRLAVWNILKK